jgi:hypothetical protein
MAGFELKLGNLGENLPHAYRAAVLQPPNTEEIAAHFGIEPLLPKLTLHLTLSERFTRVEVYAPNEGSQVGSPMWATFIDC